MRFNESDLSVVSNALRVAAERFREHANSEPGSEAFDRLCQQFLHQAEQCEAIHGRIERETGIAT